MQNQILDEAINFSLDLISMVVEVQCMGIRLKHPDKENVFPFYKSFGYKKSFLSRINCFNIENTDENNGLKCLCGQVIKGAKKELKKHFTTFGSYWHNEIDKNKINKFEKVLKIKMHCAEEDFKSLALIPLKNQKGSRGLLHVADYKNGKFNKEKICKLESIGTNFSNLILGIENLSFKIKRHAPKILIAEDEIALNQMLTRVLKKFNYQCISASNGMEAYKYLKKNKIDILITDLNMPKMNGTELIKKVRKKYEIYGPKIIVYSAYPDQVDEQMIKKYKISYVLHKPGTNILDLKNIIEEVYDEIM